MNTFVEENGARDGRVYFRLAAEIRRIGTYLLVVGLLVAALFIALQQLDLDAKDRERLYSLLFLAIVLVVCSSLFFRPWLRVDEQGIWQRRLLRWDLWSWEAFASEQIQHGGSRWGFLYPSKPSSSRSLDLRWLEENDREYLASLIKSTWKPMELPPLLVPTELTIRWGLGFRCWARLSDEGIQLGKGKRDIGCYYRWSPPHWVRITRLHHSRRDFQELELGIYGSDEPIVFGLGESCPPWKGATPEVLAAFLERVVPPDCLLITALHGPPQTRVEGEWRITELARFKLKHRRHQLLLWLGLGLPFFLVPFCRLLIAIVRIQQNLVPLEFSNWLEAGFFCVLGGFVIILGRYSSWLQNRAAEAERAELASWRTTLSQ